MIWKKALRENWWKAAVIFALLELNLFASILLYPDFQKQFGAIMQLALAKTPVVQKMLEMMGLGGFRGYFIAQHFFKGLSLLGTVAVVLLGSGFIGKEVESRTAEILLSRPVSRERILGSYFVVNALLLAGLVFLSTASAPWLSAVLIEETLEVGPLLLSALHSTLFLVSLFAATLFVSSLSSEQAKTALFLGGFFLLMALGYFIQTVNGYSIYKWNDLFLHQAILSTGRLPWEKDLFLLLGIGLLLGGSLWAFRRRDF